MVVSTVRWWVMSFGSEAYLEHQNRPDGRHSPENNVVVTAVKKKKKRFASVSEIFFSKRGIFIVIEIM